LHVSNSALRIPNSALEKWSTRQDLHLHELLPTLSRWCVFWFRHEPVKWLQGRGSAPRVDRLMRPALVYSSPPCVNFGVHNRFCPGTAAVTGRDATVTTCAPTQTRSAERGVRSKRVASHRVGVLRWLCSAFRAPHSALSGARGRDLTSIFIVRSDALYILSYASKGVEEGAITRDFLAGLSQRRSKVARSVSRSETFRNGGHEGMGFPSPASQVPRIDVR
jgi:hypothetical protein